MRATTYTYDNVGNLSSATQADGVVTSYSYDSLNRLTFEQAVLPVTNSDGSITNQNLFIETIYLNDDGLRKQVSDEHLYSDGSYPETTDAFYTYDADGRLTEEKLEVEGYPDVNSLNIVPYDDTYSYDLASNSMQETETQYLNGQYTPQGTISYTYNGDDQRVSETHAGAGIANYSITNSYDANGSLTQSVQSGSAGPTDTYTWDLRNRMVAATVTEEGVATTTTTYAYDSNGDRVSETTNAGTVSAATTYYLNDPENPTGYTKAVEESSTPGGAPTRSYVLGLRVEGQSSTTTGTDYFLLDGHGSTRSLVNMSGVMTTHYDYDAFGNALDFDDYTAPTPWLFGGDGLYDPSTGFTYQLARWRDGDIFTSFDSFEADPSSPEDLHKYLYAGANPVGLSDPSGKFFVPPSILGWVNENLAKGIALDLIVRALIGIRATYVLGQAYQQEMYPGNPLAQSAVQINRQVFTTNTLPDVVPDGINLLLRPDIVDANPGVNTIYEVKTSGLISVGQKQVQGYIGLLDLRDGAGTYSPGTWQPERSYYDVDLPYFGGAGIGPSIEIHAWNAGGGVIAYDAGNAPELIAIALRLTSEVARGISAAGAADTVEEGSDAPIATVLSVLGF